MRKEVSRIHLIIALSVALIIAVAAVYMLLSTQISSQTSTMTSSQVKNKISIQNVHLWANTSNLYPLTLGANLLISSPLRSLNISVDGVKVSSEPFSQDNITNWRDEEGIEIKNPHVVILVGKAYVVSFTGLFNDNSVYTTSATVIAQPPFQSYISLEGGVELETKSIYPTPYLSATIFVNRSVPLSKLTLFINGTLEASGSQGESNKTIYGLIYKAQPSNQAMPIIAGRTYEVTFVAIFEDNSTSTASKIVVAG